MTEAMMRGLVLSLLLSLGLMGVARGAEPHAALSLLAEPRTHAIMRHALAPGTSDPSGFDVSDCTTQRNLNEAGREQARQTGAVMRDAGVSFDGVWTSQWCRCVETADLLNVGEVEQVAALNSFFEDRSTASEQTETLRARLLALPADETVMMVTHQVNMTALLGGWVDSGEVVVFTLGENGTVQVRNRFVLPAR